MIIHFIVLSDTFQKDFDIFTNTHGARYRTLSYRCRQFFAPVVRKRARYHVFESRQTR